MNKEKLIDDFNYMLEVVNSNSILKDDCGIGYYWDKENDYKLSKKADYIQRDDESKYEFITRIYEDIVRINEVDWSEYVDIKDNSIDEY